MSLFARLSRLKPHLLAVAPGVVLLLAGPSPVLAQGQPSIVELAYDDGQPVDTLDFGEASFFATRFSPPSFPARILQLKYFLVDTSQGTSFFFSIHEDNDGEPAGILFGPIHVSGGHLGWNTFDLRAYDVVVNADFHFAIALDSASNLQLGAENREPLSGRTNLGDCCGWWRFDADLLVRAVVELLPTGVEVEAPSPEVFSLKAYPNPFRTRTTIEARLPRFRRAALRLVDVAGRTVRQWILGDGGAGWFRASWDGRDAGGRPLPSGVYVILLRTDNRLVLSEKVFLLR